MRTMARRIVLAVFLLTALALDPIALPAFAATLTVTTTDDELVTNGRCSLREAVRNANADAVLHPDCPAGAGADLITLPAGTISLALPGENEDAALTGDLDLTSEIRLVGNGAGTTIIDGGGFPVGDRILDIAPVGSATVTVERLTLRNGFTNGAGGAIRNNAQGRVSLREVELTGSRSFGGGGGISNNGTATLTDVTVGENRASSGPDGGGIANSGALVATRVLLVGNSAGGGIIPGGGGLASSGGSADLTNVTITQNSVSNVGGGVRVQNGVVTLTNVTISQNGAGRGGNNVSISGGTLRLRNTIVAIDDDDNCRRTGGTFQSQGNNLDTGVSCGFNQPGDLSNTDPALGPLADNGGLTQTMALQGSSLAIDAGTNTDCPSTDQRGASRPRDGNGDGTATCDIGAFEAADAPLVGTPASKDENKDGNKEDSPAKETEEQRQQRQLTNRSNRDDVQNEGNVVEVGTDEQGPFIVMANRDGLVTVRLQCGADCPTIRVGDYVQVSGVKEHEGLFFADEVDVASR